LKALPANPKSPFENARTVGDQERSKKVGRKFRANPATAPARFEVTVDVVNEVNAIVAVVRCPVLRMSVCFGNCSPGD
jgi:hypothetical protein